MDKPFAWRRARTSLNAARDEQGKSSLLEHVFFVVLVLNATGLFRFLAAGFKEVDISHVSLALWGLMVVYLMAKADYLAPALREIRAWCVLLLVWPIVTVVRAPSIEIREIGLTFYFFLLFASTAIYVAANGLAGIRRVMTASLAISVIGLLLSMVMPDSFRAVAALADAETDYGGRPYGFFMQPNALATGLVLLFVAWFALWEHKTVVKEPVVLLAFLLTLLLTGSRTAMIAGVLVVAIHFVCQLKPGRTRYASVRALPFRATVMCCCMVAGVAAARVGVGSLGQYLQSSDDLVARATNLLHFRFNNDSSVLSDGSIQDRLSAQEVYWALVRERPWFGHGIGSETFYYETGPIHLVSHSSLLSCLMQYGSLYTLLFCLLLGRIYWHRQRATLEAKFRTNSILQFVIVVPLLFVVNGGILNMRVFFVVWGAFVGIAYFSQDAVERRAVNLTCRSNAERVMHSAPVTLHKRSERRGWPCRVHP